MLNIREIINELPNCTKVGTAFTAGLYMGYTMFTPRPSVSDNLYYSAQCILIGFYLRGLIENREEQRMLAMVVLFGFLAGQVLGVVTHTDNMISRSLSA